MCCGRRADRHCCCAGPSPKHRALARKPCNPHHASPPPPGHDTTASLIAWATYALSQNREAEAKLVAEVDQVLGSCREFTGDHLQALKYVGAVVKEALRLWPPGEGGGVRGRKAAVRGG